MAVTELNGGPSVAHIRVSVALLSSDAVVIMNIRLCSEIEDCMGDSEVGLMNSWYEAKVVDAVLIAFEDPQIVIVRMKGDIGVIREYFESLVDFSPAQSGACHS